MGLKQFQAVGVIDATTAGVGMVPGKRSARGNFK